MQWLGGTSPSIGGRPPVFQPELRLGLVHSRTAHTWPVHAHSQWGCITSSTGEATRGPRQDIQHSLRPHCRLRAVYNATAVVLAPAPTTPRPANCEVCCAQRAHRPMF